MLCCNSSFSLVAQREINIMYFIEKLKIKNFKSRNIITKNYKKAPVTE